MAAQRKWKVKKWIKTGYQGWVKLVERGLGVVWPNGQVSKVQARYVAVIVFVLGVVGGSYATLSRVVIPWIRALDETSLSMPQSVVFNRGTEGGLAGYETASASAYVLANEVRLATSSAWLDGAYLYKKPITLKNLSGAVLASTGSAQIIVNTKELYDAGKLQSDCDDLRVAFVATASGSVRQELPRSYFIASGATNCSDSTATTVTFPRRENIWTNSTDSNYELYYGNPLAVSTYGDNGYDIQRADGSTVSATLVCPFNGTTTCADGETPTSSQGAIRYSGSKSALSFDGSNDQVDITANLGSGYAEATIEAWVYQSGGGNVPAYIGKAAGSCSYEQGLYKYFGSGVKFDFEIGGVCKSVTTGSNPTGGWHHIAGVYNGTTFTLFYDGSSAATTPATGTVDLGNNWRVGRGLSWAQLYQGYIDEVRISTVARYTSNFTPSTTPFEPDANTKLLLHFDENGDDPRNTGKAIDASGNGNHGTITGAKYVGGLVGVDSSATTTGNTPSGTYASHQGIFLEEGTTNLITNPSFENSTSSLLNWGYGYFNYATASATFTGSMAKRNSAGPFAAGVLVQGDPAGGTKQDILSASQGSLINGGFYSNFDTGQGSIVFWITPEWNGNDGLRHDLINAYYSNSYVLYKHTDNKLYWDFGWANLVSTDVSSWQAGQTYSVVVRWDRRNKLDGINYLSMSVNDSHAYGLTNVTALGVAPAGINVGGYSSNPGNAIIEGLTIYRRPLFDGLYGVDVGNGDEINRIYNSGTGQDPTLVTGSWDVVFALPTNASTGSLTTGTGNAWSHPHASNLLYTSTTNTGGFMMNGTYTNDGWADEGTPASASALYTDQKIYAGGYLVTSDAADEGIYYDKTVTGGNDFVIRSLAHSDGTCVPRTILYDQTGGVEIGHLDGLSTSNRATPSAMLFTGEIAGSGSKTLRVKLINTASSGTCYWHQVELLNNLVNDPSFEAGSSDPWLPSGWTNYLVDSGEIIQETGVIHSGVSALKFPSSGLVNEWFWYGIAGQTVGDFFAIGTYAQTNGSSSTSIGGQFGSNLFQQKSITSNTENISFGNTISVWKMISGVMRANQTTLYPEIGGSGDATKNYYADDYYFFPLTNVSLTVTPASSTNSTETSGLRVDGVDTLTQPISNISSSSGVFKFKFTPRHSVSTAALFGETSPVIASMSAATNEYIGLAYKSSTLIELVASASGTARVAGWSSPTLNAGTTYNMELSYQPGTLQLKVDGTSAATAYGLGSFGVQPTTAYLGSDKNGGRQYDGTYTSFVSATPTANSTAPYYKFGSKSVKLDGYNLADQYTIQATASANAIYTLSAYVYNGTTGAIGGTVDSSVAMIASGSGSLIPTYSDTGGGWWRLTYTTPTIPAGTYNLGVEVKPGKTIYVDGVQMENKPFATTYADGSLGTGYAWSGATSNSNSVRTATDLQYSITNNINKDLGSVSFWLRSPLSNASLVANTNYWIFSWLEGSTGNGYYVKTYGNGGGFSIQKYIAWNTSNYASVSKTFSANEWMHLVATWSTTNGMKIYVNNSSPGTNSNTTSLSSVNNTFSLSSDWAFSDFKIYNTELSNNEVAQLYNQGLTTHTNSTESNDRYVASGEYTSPVIDLSANGEWGSTPISFANTLNGGTVSYLTRTSPDNSTWSSWAPVVGSAVASDPRRYLQWKAQLTAPADLNETPVITGMTTTFVQDTTAPVNPDQTALGYATAASSSATLISGDWYHFPQPKFTWEEGADAAASGQSASGIDAYHTLLTQDQEASPSAETGDPCYRLAQSDDRLFTVGADPGGCSLVNGTYYLKVQTKDNSGNVAEPVTLFTYRYDGSNPNSPVSVSSTTVGYTSQNTFDFYWPTATDNGPSGVLGYEFKTGSLDPTDPFSNWQYTAGTTAYAVKAYQEGQNFFFVRTVDNAGNVSAEMSNLGVSPFYYNASAPSSPQNLAISPSTSEGAPSAANVFSVTWDKPATYSGELAKYYYCVNCTPSATAMTETTSSETVNRALTNLALATQQGKNTFYLVAEDNNINTETGHGNRNFEAYAAADFWASTVAPGSPQNLTITDASDRDNDQWRLTLAWEAPATGGTPASYHMYRSTDNTSFTKIGETTATAYTDASLTQSKTYYYKVKAVDNANSESLFSNTVSKSPEGRYKDPPSAGGVPTATPGSTTATITWSTSRVAFGTVEYGKDTTYGKAAAETAGTANHSIKITGLAPGTTYHFRVQALDDSSLVGYERSSAYSADYSFTTLNMPTISEVVVADIELDSVVISWKTASLATSQVEYGLTTEYGSKVTVSTLPDESIHTARLTNLAHTTKYHFRVRGTTADGDDIYSEDNTFETMTFPKVTALVMNTDQSASGTSVAIAWSTNVPTTGTVEYQPMKVEIEKETDRAVITEIDSELTTQGQDGWDVDIGRLQKLSQTDLARLPLSSQGTLEQQFSGVMEKRHLMRITGLNDGAVYVFTVRGRDKNGNEAVSEPIRYVTGADTRPPKIFNSIIETPISGVGIEAKAQLIISWETDEPSTTQVKWGTGTGSEYPNTSQLETNLSTQHTVVIRDLTPVTSYHLKLLSTDQAGNSIESEDTVVVTPAAQQAAFEIILKNLESVFGFLKL